MTFVSHVGLPLLIFATISRTALPARALLLPCTGLLMILAMWLLAAFFGRSLDLDRSSRGSLIVSCMVMNTTFEYPFVIAFLGSGGASMLALFDLGNAVALLTLVSALAASFGHHRLGVGGLLLRVFSFPPLVAAMLGVALNILNAAPPPAVLDVMEAFGRWAVLLVLVAMGLLFNPTLIAAKPVVFAVAIRVVGGATVGWLIASTLELESTARDVVLLGCAAPVGFTAVVLAERESLDVELAAGAASLSVLLGLFYIPALLLL